VAVVRADASSPPAAAGSEAGVKPVHRPVHRARKKSILNVNASYKDNLFFPAVVFLDGKKIGTAPLRQKGLTPGRHVIVVRHSGYKTQRKTVVLRPGGTTRAFFKMEK
jgi:hypothetical protein